MTTDNLDFSPAIEPSRNELDAVKPMLVLPDWHKPYAEALMESDAAKLPIIINLAKRAILDRYLEACVSPVSAAENRDLQNATDVLYELKRAHNIEGLM